VTRIAMPSPMLPPSLTVAPDASMTDSVESAPAVTDFPLTVATRRAVEGSTTHRQSGEAAARGAQAARRGTTGGDGVEERRYGRLYVCVRLREERGERERERE